MAALWERSTHLPFKVIQGSTRIKQKNTAEADKDISSLFSVPCYGWGKVSSLACKQRIQPACQNLPQNGLPAVQWLGFLVCRNKYEQIWKSKQALLVVGVSLWNQRCEEGVFSEGTQNGRVPHVNKWVLSQLAACRCWSRSTIHHCCELSWHPTAGIPLSQSALQNQRGGIAPLWEISSKISSCPWLHEAPGSVISLEALYKCILFLLILKDCVALW